MRKLLSGSGPAGAGPDSPGSCDDEHSQGASSFFPGLSTLPGPLTPFYTNIATLPAWGWLLVDILWLDEPLRGAGLGTKLLRQAEAEAQEAGCSRAVLDTLEFQALPFYERHGYSVFGVLEDYPPGFRRYHLQKKLTS